MVFLVCCCLFCVPDELNVVPPQDDVALRKSLVSVSTQGLPNGVEPLIVSPGSSSPGLAVRREPFFRAWWGVLSNLPFLLFVLGNGAYTFTLGVFNTYGPDLFVGLGLFSDETSASLVFGIIVAVGGLLGTPLGGYLIDRQTKDTDVPGKRCFVAMTSSFVYVTLAEVFILIMCFLGGAKVAFLVCFTIGLFCMCALWGPQMVAILELFPESRRSLAISANAVIIHIFGDVPAPTIMGVVWDAWALTAGPSRARTATPTSIRCAARTRAGSRTSCCSRRCGCSGPCCSGRWPRWPSRGGNSAAASCSPRRQSIRERRGG